MATAPLNSENSHTLMTFKQATDYLSRDERFHATVYAMNSLLVQKGIYSPEEFEFQFRQFAEKEARKSKFAAL
jgi:hypothetical protein